MYPPRYWVILLRISKLCNVQARFLAFDCLLCYNASAFWGTLLPGGANLTKYHPLRLNVGFLLNKDVGHSRNFDFEESSLLIGEDFSISDLRGSARLSRTGQGIYVEGHLQGNIDLECVRCLSECSQVLSAELNELFDYPPEKDSDPHLSISEDAILDLGPILRESFLLDLPIQPICRIECMGLCPVCGEVITEEHQGHPEEDIDPRLSVLKTLLS